MIHYGIGIGPAVLYSIVQDRLPSSGAARGALYGLTIFLTQDEALNAATGLSGRPQDYPWQAHARGLIAHLVYGIVTDAVVTIAKEQLRSSHPDGRSAGGPQALGRSGVSRTAGPLSQS
jgi:uncharacterized membrane protein YagU involved in acid resistance